MASSVYSPKGRLIGAIIAGALLLLGFVLSFIVDASIARVFTWASLAVGLLYGLHAAWEALRKLTFDIDVLMVLGAVAAAAIGHPGEGALLLFLFTLSGALEEYAAGRTQREVASLHKLMPVDALALRGSEFVPVPAESRACARRRNTHQRHKQHGSSRNHRRKHASRSERGR
jgi:Cd2+/Zn2+-exporting ATPase